MEKLRTGPWVTCCPTGSQHQDCWAWIHNTFLLFLISPAHSPRMSSFCRAWKQRNSSFLCYFPPVFCSFSLDTLFSEAPARNAGTEKHVKTAEMFTNQCKRSVMLLSFPKSGNCLSPSGRGPEKVTLLIAVACAAHK